MVMKVANKVKKASISEENEIGKLIKIIIIVTIIFLAFYLLTILINKKEENVVKQPVQIQYSEILLGNMLKQKENEYYVLIYDTEDLYVNMYRDYLSYYKNNTKDALKYYTSVLNNPLNYRFIGEELNVDDNIDNLKVNETTLVKIKNHKIVGTYQEDALKEYLKEITK